MRAISVKTQLMFKGLSVEDPCLLVEINGHRYFKGSPSYFLELERSFLNKDFGVFEGGMEFKHDLIDHISYFKPFGLFCLL
jgi:hypothetical protein